MSFEIIDQVIDLDKEDVKIIPAEEEHTITADYQRYEPLDKRSDMSFEIIEQDDGITIRRVPEDPDAIMDHKTMDAWNSFVIESELAEKLQDIDGFLGLNVIPGKWITVAIDKDKPEAANAIPLQYHGLIITPIEIDKDDLVRND